MNNLKNVELLSPVGDFECLKAAVQNGADSVYFGGSIFNARASATNFSYDDLKNAIQYAKIRGVKTNLTLNILIKDSEFDDAVNLAKFAYQSGIDAIIVQDLGLANYLIKNFPDLPIHASTQMTIHNLEGALEAEKIGFKRVVLSREVSLAEIKNICSNTNVEIEVFVHGALCISYSGQCLLSSMIGGRSGNRGRCAQPCRLPYKLISNNTKNEIIDEGYLLSTRDLCSLEYIPELIKSGVKCFKIEGRMKPPEYVATVTRIYKKYINLAQSNYDYIIDEKDKKDLLQVFNRGGFSSGHLNSEPNLDLVYPKKQNNMGLYLGTVHDFNSSKGYITLKLSEDLKIGDTISLEKESGTYTVSELMINGINSPTASIGNIVKIGRMKGNISINDKIFKISNKELSVNARKTFSDIEIKKHALECEIFVKEHQNISITITGDNLQVSCNCDIIPEKALNHPISSERIIDQLSKTGNTPYEFKDIKVHLDDGLYIPAISCLNELRRSCIAKFNDLFIKTYCTRLLPEITSESISKIAPETISEFSNDLHLKNMHQSSTSISILINNLVPEFDYTTLQNVNNIYIPIKYFLFDRYSDSLKNVANKYNLYIYMPLIFKNTNTDFNKILSNFKIKGFILSNISQLYLLDNYKNDYEFIANYGFNIFNRFTQSKLKELNIKTITLSPELNKDCIIKLLNNSININNELIVYGKLPVMNINYCLLGKSNKCYSNCTKQCKNSNSCVRSCNTSDITHFYLKDRIGLDFEIIPDSSTSTTTIYNSKITSININSSNLNRRIDFLNEDLEQMQIIINTILSGERLEGQQYTNGNFNKEI